MEIAFGILVVALFLAAYFVIKSINKNKYVFFDTKGERITDQAIINQKLEEAKYFPLVQPGL